VATADVQVKSRTGQSRGLGSSRCPIPTRARAAIEALNGREHRDRPLTVNESRPRRTVRDLYAGGGWYGGGLAKPSPRTRTRWDSGVPAGPVAEPTGTT